MIVAQTAELGPFETYFVRLVDTDVGAILAAGAVVAAFAVGAAHAVAPGHGKSIAAAYLLGSDGRVRDAIALGGVVSAMHTGSVIVLGLLLYVAIGGPFAIDALVPWMMLASGLLVLAVGAGLLGCHLHGRKHAHDPHLPHGVSPFSRQGLVTIGLAGGLLPSPSAFLVLVTALFIDRILYGLALVAAFSLGLATTVAAVGVLTLRGRDVIALHTTDRAVLARVTRHVPLVASVAVLIGGGYLTTVAALRI